MTDIYPFPAYANHATLIGEACAHLSAGRRILLTRAPS
jgi:hypothetical protein